MSNFEFLQLLYSDYREIIPCLIVALIIVVILMNRLCSSFLNPAVFSIFTASIGLCVVVFLYVSGNTSAHLFGHVIITSLIFWSLLWFFFPKKAMRSKVKIKGEFAIRSSLFKVVLFLYILLNSVTYMRLGVPLFNEDSRLTTYTDSGLGVFERVFPVLRAYILFYVFWRFDTKKITWKGLLVLLAPIIVVGVLSGSRSSFIEIIFAFWGYKTLFANNEPKLWNYRLLVVPFLVISVITFSLQNSSNYTQGLVSLGERVVASGDWYWQTMPNDLWRELSVKTPVKDNLLGFLGPLRIIRPSECDEGIGFQISHLANGGDRVTGPVPLFPMSGLIYFGGIGGIVFTIIQALILISLSRLFYKKSDSLIVSTLCYVGYKNSLAFLTSIDIASGFLFDAVFDIFFFMFIVGILAAVSAVSKVKHEPEIICSDSSIQC